MGIANYEIVVGLEVHVELKTDTKLFCSCSTKFGAPANTQCCPVCMGFPGALPVWNRRAVELAVLAGLALDCSISSYSRADRKQYFYPDLPKAYQISQGDYPLCRDGGLTVSLGNEKKRIRISRIHIEEDAGKLVHRGESTLVDGNRCGVPLIEIVTEADFRSGEEATAYLQQLRAVLLTAGISDCKMQEGSLRCDVNLSVRKEGSQALGARTEIKNINSFAFVRKAIEYEAKRQIEVLESGGSIPMQTRRFDAATGKTELMRVKERSEDYRLLPEADLPPLLLSEQDMEAIRRTLPELPAARLSRLVEQYGIGEQSAAVLTSVSALADYFECGAKATAYPALLSNLLINELLRDFDGEEFASSISPLHLAELAELLGEETINSATAKKLLPRLTEGESTPRAIVEAEKLSQIRDGEILLGYIRTATEETPCAVADYRNGKRAALQALLGRVMALSAGRADPTLARTLLEDVLKQNDNL